MNLGQRLQSADRRVIYLILLASMAIVLLKPLGLPIRVVRETQMVYDAIEALGPDDLFVISFDYSAANVPELHPAAIAWLTHAFRNNVKVACIGLVIEGGSWAEDALNLVLPDFPEKEYGVDYINIGYKPGGMVFLEKLGTDVDAACAGQDAYGKPLTSFPIMARFQTAKDISLAASLTSGDPGYNQWIANVSGPHGVPITTATIAPGFPAAIPLITSGKLQGALRGMRGAAEYEVLIDQKGTATAGMDAQSLGHVIVILFIVLGNLGLFIEKREQQNMRGGAA